MPTQKRTAESYQRYLDRSAAGLCKTCNEPAATGKMQCENCLQYFRDQNRKNYEAARTAGLCTKCAKRPAIVSQTLCTECREHQRQAAKKRYRDRRASGICYSCGKSGASKASGLCSECREVSRQGSLRRRNPNREKALERDGFRCRMCGESKPKLFAHHIDETGHGESSHPNHSLDNLITLCLQCHIAIERVLKNTALIPVLLGKHLP